MKFSKLSGVIATAAILGTAMPAMAVPTLYPRAGNRLGQVRNTTKSVVIGDTTSANQLYVLPPQTGGVELANLFYSGNTGFCQEMHLLQGASFNLAQKIKEKSTEILSHEAELDGLRRQKGVLMQEAAALFADERVKAVEKLADRIEEIEDRIDQLRDDAEDCTTDACEDDIADEIDQLKAEKTQLKRDLRDAERAAGDAWRAYERAKKKVEAKQSEIDDVFAQVQAIVAELVRAKNQIFELYKQYGVLEGGLAGIDFNTGWSANLSTLRTANPSFTVNTIETSDVRVYPAMIPGLGTDSYLASLPSVLGYTINGLEFDPKNITTSLPAFPDRMSGNVRLSLIGACPYKYPADWDLADGQNGLPLYGLTATYQYPSAFRTHVEAFINLWTVYEHMKKMTTEGGFFNTSTHVDEREDTDGAFGAHFVIRDEGNMNSDEIRALRDQLRWETMADVIRLMAVPASSGSNGDVNPLAPGDSGATVVANGIDQTCGWYSPWCTGASWILRGLQAIFGSSEAEAKFKQTHNFTVQRTYDTEQTQKRAGVVTFTTAAH